MQRQVLHKCMQRHKYHLVSISDLYRDDRRAVSCCLLYVRVVVATLAEHRAVVVYVLHGHLLAEDTAVGRPAQYSRRVLLLANLAETKQLV